MTIALIQLADVREVISICLAILSCISTLLILYRQFSAMRVCDICPLRPGKKDKS